MKLGDSLVNMAIAKKLLNPSRKQAYDELIRRSNMRYKSESSDSHLGKVFDDSSSYSGQSKMTNPNNSRLMYNRMTTNMTDYEETKKQNNLH
jgi:peptide methionine sulfoxide reductase MsrB